MSSKSPGKCASVVAQWPIIRLTKAPFARLIFVDETVARVLFLIFYSYREAVMREVG